MRLLCHIITYSNVTNEKQYSAEVICFIALLNHWLGRGTAGPLLPLAETNPFPNGLKQEGDASLPLTTTVPATVSFLFF